jgi:DNA-cytosine methyltransferase
MRHGSLFSGIGGFDLAAQWMNWTNVFHTEWNEFGQKVLKHHFPNSISYHDIIKTDYTIHNGDIDIITGGFPCQPFSLAGKRKGTDDERYLWHEMLRAIQQIQPTYVVAENVRGLLTIDGGLVFEQVCADLEAEGYEVQPVLLPAAGVNAPHRRDRISLWLSTPRASEVPRSEKFAKGRTMSPSEYAVTIGMLPTPRTTGQESYETRAARKGHDSAMSYLESHVDYLNQQGLLPTPCAAEGSGKVSGNDKEQKSVTQIVVQTHGKTSQLNPRFVAEMMGFPTDWTISPFLKWRNEA